MDITYLGHSSFKIRGKTGTVVTDPFPAKIGFPFPKVSADIVTVSHHHFDHDAVAQISGTSRREQPFIIDLPGEYELLDVSVFGYQSYHDDQKGSQRGKNIMMVIKIDGISVVHLGDLGHTLSDQSIQELGVVDVLMVPVGGVFTVDSKQARAIIEMIEPSIIIPMHYKTASHSRDFSQLAGIEDFLKEMGKTGREPVEKLTLTAGNLPEEMEVAVMKQYA